MENKNNTNLPEVHEELQKLRKLADESGAVLIGETWTSNVAELDRYYGHNLRQVARLCCQIGKCASHCRPKHLPCSTCVSGTNRGVVY